VLNPQGATPTLRGIDDRHQFFAIPFIRGVFPDAVVDAIRLHVGAKRALCALEPDYYEGLSEDSRRSLTLQGGVFTSAQANEFAAKPHGDKAMRVRRWDDRAKVAGARTRELSHYLQIAGRCVIR
jgi:predicted HD phosphohydrolase